MSNHVAVGDPEQLGHASINSLDFSVQCGGESNVVEGIDEFLETALRPGNDFSQLIELFTAGRGRSLL